MEKNKKTKVINANQDIKQENCGFNNSFGIVTITTLSNFILNSTAKADRGPCPPYPSLETCLGWNQGQT